MYAAGRVLAHHRHLHVHGRSLLTQAALVWLRRAGIFPAGLRYLGERKTIVVNLSVAITYHPRRPDYLPALLKRLDRQLAPVTVVSDEREEGLWPTTKRAWQQIASTTTHILVMQDDVLPCQ